MELKLVLDGIRPDFREISDGKRSIGVEEIMQVQFAPVELTKQEYLELVGVMSEHSVVARIGQ